MGGRGKVLEVAVKRRLPEFTLDAEFVAQPGVTVLFGHSGSGKSMTLRCIAGLVTPDQGRVKLGEELLFDASEGVDLAPRRRGLGLVTQEPALFPHLSVRDNVAFGLGALPRGERGPRADEALALLDLAPFARRRPASLSGGQRQRVALARALAPSPGLLLLDEPFSALDDVLRRSLRQELLRLCAQLELTVVFVTHDLREAHLLADRLAVFDAGQVLQEGPRDAVFRWPASRRVAELTGVANLWRGVVAGSTEGAVRVGLAGLVLDCAAPRDGVQFAEGETVDVGIRAERVVMHRSGAPGGPNVMTARLGSELAYGSIHTLRLEPVGPGPALEVEVAARPYEVLNVAGGGPWSVEMPRADLHVMKAGG
jgi:molybdate transport system ATP-binding protein